MFDENVIEIVYNAKLHQTVVIFVQNIAIVSTPVYRLGSMLSSSLKEQNNGLVLNAVIHLLSCTLYHFTRILFLFGIDLFEH